MNTPQRQLPGGFIQTPAPARQPVLRTVSGQQLQPQQPNGVAPPTQLAQPFIPIEHAARAINIMLNVEATYPVLEEYVKQGISADYDISSPPNATPNAQSHIPSSWAPFQQIKKYDIPDRVYDQYSSADLMTSMGLFAELHHAWVVIDSFLYLWDYTHPNPEQTELIGFEELTEAITSVKMVRPRPGVFNNNVTHLLVLTTTDYLHLVGVATSQSPAGVTSVSLYRTDMKVVIKGLDVNCIAGSPSTGRLFVGSGTTNDVYEITYQQEEKWFSSKCSKICQTDSGLGSSLTKSFSSSLTIFGSQSSQAEFVVQLAVDDTRSLVYTLSSTSTIRVFHMKPGQSLPLLITKTTSEIMTVIGHMISRPRNDLLTPNQKLVSISPISAVESSRLYLMVTTSTGVRIYLSATSGSYYVNDANTLPSSMQPHHVKFPPPTKTPTSSSSTQVAPYQGVPDIDTSSKSLVHTRIANRHAPGYFLCFVNSNPNAPLSADRLFLTAPETGRLAKQLEPGQPRQYTESGQWISLPGVTADIGLVSAPFAATAVPQGFGNELAVQFDQTAAEFAVLTNHGVHTIRRRRLVDIFASALRSNPDGFEETIKQFVRLYGRAETCATAIAVACGQSMDVGADARIVPITDPDIIENARRAFIEYGGKPSLNDSNGLSLAGTSIEDVRPSPRADGLTLYVSRLVRSIWRQPILREESTPAGGLMVTSRIDSVKLQTIQQDLVALKEFLDTNKSSIGGLDGPEALRGASTKQDELTLQGEHRSLTALLKTVDSIIEGIAFVNVLADDPMEEIVLSLSDSSRQRLRQLTYEGLFVTGEGRDLAKELVKAIVNRSIARGANVDTVAEGLRRRCGSFCSADDVVIFKAQEQLKRASEAGADTSSGRSLLNDSCKLFQKVATSLSSEHLKMAIKQYIAMSFFAGAIRLILTVAQQRDRANKALSWIKDGRPVPDSRQDLYDLRTNCYMLICEIIEAVDQASDDGIDSTMMKRKEEAYIEINQSDDEVFQTFLYDWYLTKGWSDRLLEIESSHVINYLRRKSTDEAIFADLLWRYYSRFNQFFEAAKVLLQLAKSGFPIDLSTRVGHLSRAKANASARTNGLQGFGRTQQTKQEVVREINDLLDLANIQEDILQRLKADSRVGPDRRDSIIAELDGIILPLDTLFNAYADQANYYDLCLIIYQVADFRDSTAINATWESYLRSVVEEAHDTQQAQAFELVSTRFRDLGKRLNCSDVTFPIPFLLPLVVDWAIEDWHKQGRTDLPLWTIDLFIELGVAHEIPVATLEEQYYNSETPWSTMRYKTQVAQLLIYTIEVWYKATARGAGIVFGSAENSIAMLEIINSLLTGDELQGRSKDDAERVRDLVDRSLW